MVLQLASEAITYYFYYYYYYYYMVYLLLFLFFVVCDVKHFELPYLCEKCSIHKVSLTDIS